MEKNNFETLAENRIEIMQRICLDEELAKCLLNKSPKFKDTTVSPVEMAGLMYSQVFPYARTQNTLTEAKSYITMQFKYKKVKGANIFKTASITIYAFCADSLVKTQYSIIRPDYLIQRIDLLMNDTRAEGWLGKLSMDSMSDVIFDNGYVGLAVTYTNTEFQ